AEAAGGQLVEAAAARAGTEEVATQAAGARDECQEAAQHARRAADALAGLAFRLRERPRWRTRLRELGVEAAEAAEAAAGQLERARAADEDRRTVQRVADDARRTARALRAERAEVSGVPDEGEHESAPAAGSPSLPALREAYRSASQLYEKVGVGADLRAEQARAEGDESAALAALDRLSNKVRTRAARLLEGPEGADGPSRQAAAARAESLVQLLESRASTASEQLGRLRGEAERLAPAEGEAHIELPAERIPADAAGAKDLLRAATAELAAHEDAHAAAVAAHEDLLRDHRAAQEAAGGFEETAASLRDQLRDPAPGAASADAGETAAEPPAEPYQGGLAEARQAAADARRALRTHAGGLVAAEAAVAEAGDRLVRHANSTRYEQVRTPARQQIRELPAAALPANAAAWAEAFAPRLRVLTDELEQLERNRDGIVDRLRGLVESALATLRSAQRLSRLPEGLGEWSGQEFLRIRFEDPDQATLTERLGEVIDETTRAAVRKNSDLRRDGVSLLLRGVQAALAPKGVRVEILKPDAVLRAERVPVGQMGDVFSGGQLLTAAIALYCTMAALRGNDRGRDRHRHAGTLFLDNPIGRANATYLLELQRAVADALGVQLLYTTGLFDTTALAEFPLVIRLRNDADLRAGLKYISVEEHLRPGLPQQDPAAEPVHGEITATRVFRKPRAGEAH
ncbi:coiled-coil domain-containing protein, partial [Streptomyces mayteni]